MVITLHQNKTLTNQLPSVLPKSCTIWLENPKEQIEELVAWFSNYHQTEVEIFTIGKLNFAPKTEDFPDNPLLSRMESHKFFQGLPNLRKLKVYGWGLFDTISHPLIEELYLDGCPIWDPGVWNGPIKDGMVFSNLRKLVWERAEDKHGLSCFEGAGLVWALDRSQTPKLLEIEASDATSAQLCDMSLKKSQKTPFERVRISSIWEEDEIRVRIKKLEITYVDNTVNYAAIAKKYKMAIYKVKADGSTILIAD
ncbi:hypothetical protein [Pseudozobellia sp. WGM2]|uniref:hypothetical protein n=1 Tax=Pseudozobellia sp. WGM2 TaxID=2787625 RepID=UPI001ADF71A8|nr:hypothetical protein [Pseudozobellia sp. WGM2]